MRALDKLRKLNADSARRAEKKKHLRTRYWHCLPETITEVMEELSILQELNRERLKRNAKDTDSASIYPNANPSSGAANPYT